jgi:hypothetical protein
MELKGDLHIQRAVHPGLCDATKGPNPNGTRQDLNKKI